jgi:hypothetical protein
MSEPKETSDPVRFKALASIKWKDRHFHVICDAVNSESGVLLLIDPRAFPPEATYPDYPGQLEVRQPPDSLRKVEGKEYRYLSVSLVDLDMLASGS